MAAYKMRDDRIALADDLAVFLDVRKLPSRRAFRVEDVDVAKRQSAKLQKAINLALLDF
jgi:hypothetical protein